MQTAKINITDGANIELWRGLPAQIEISGIDDIAGEWVFFVDFDWVDGSILNGTVAADGENLIVTLDRMDSKNLSAAIQGRSKLQCRATLTDQTSRVFFLGLTVLNRGVAGAPQPVASYYTKEEIDRLLEGLSPGGDMVESVNGQTGAVVLDATDVGAVALPAITALTAVSGAITVPAVHGAVYTYTLTGGESITLGAAPTGQDATFELWLTQPATAVAFTLATSVIWADGDEFSAQATAPDTSGANTLYALVFRWTGSHWLGNLAYTEKSESSNSGSQA